MHGTVNVALYGKMISADVIKILKWGDYPGTFTWAPCPIMGVLKR